VAVEDRWWDTAWGELKTAYNRAWFAREDVRVKTEELRKAIVHAELMTASLDAQMEALRAHLAHLFPREADASAGPRAIRVPDDPREAEKGRA
jgi:hypothetical protein